MREMLHGTLWKWARYKVRVDAVVIPARWTLGPGCAALLMLQSCFVPVRIPQNKLFCTSVSSLSICSALKHVDREDIFARS